MSSRIEDVRVAIRRGNETMIGVGRLIGSDSSAGSAMHIAPSQGGLYLAAVPCAFPARSDDVAAFTLNSARACADPSRPSPLLERGSWVRSSS